MRHDADQQLQLQCAQGAAAENSKGFECDNNQIYQKRMVEAVSADAGAWHSAEDVSRHPRG